MNAPLQPTQPSLQPMTTTPSYTGQNWQANQSVYNPADGKTYTVQQQVPGKGLTVLDPSTGQSMAISEQDTANLKPALKTSNLCTVEDIAREIVAELTGEILPKVKVAKVYNENQRNFIMKAKDWKIIRKDLKTKSSMTEKELSEFPTYNESRQDQFLREHKEAAFHPYKGDIDETGHDKKTGLPAGETKEIEVGMTEFPYGVDKEKNPEGYGKMTMEQMDEKFEEEHPHFNNEKKLPQQTMMREEDDDYFKGKERLEERKKDEADSPKPRYSPEYTQMADELFKEAADEGEIEKLPVQYKDVKKAPGKDMGYVEPNVIENASPDVKAAIELLRNTQKEIEDIQKQIKEKTDPLQKAIQEATAPLQSELQTKAQALKSCLDIIHDELSKTGDKVATFEDSIYAALNREKAVAPPASLPQILKKADEIDTKLAEEIRKLKATLESENTKLVLEQFVYKYPISEVQKKKISALEEEIKIDRVVYELLSIINELKSFNKEM